MLGVPWFAWPIRSTCTTFLCESGASPIQLMRARRWRSGRVAEGYIAQTRNEKKQAFLSMNSVQPLLLWIWNRKIESDICKRDAKRSNRPDSGVEHLPLGKRKRKSTLSDTPMELLHTTWLVMTNRIFTQFRNLAHARCHQSSTLHWQNIRERGSLGGIMQEVDLCSPT